MIGAFDSGARPRALVLALALTVLSGTAAVAEDAPTREEEAKTALPPAAPDAVKPPSADETPSGDVKLKEVEIRGELEKPKIFFILPKAQRDAETRERRIRFYPDILEPLDKDRFEEEARVLYQHGIPAE